MFTNASSLFFIATASYPTTTDSLLQQSSFPQNPLTTTPVGRGVSQGGFSPPIIQHTEPATQDLHSITPAHHRPNQQPHPAIAKRSFTNASSLFSLTTALFPASTDSPRQRLPSRTIYPSHNPGQLPPHHRLKGGGTIRGFNHPLINQHAELAMPQPTRQSDRHIFVHANDNIPP
jgi:hypothetical protein